MQHWQQRTAAIALGLIVVGVFLPWEVAGDLIPYWTPGIQLWPRLADSGGLAILTCAALSAWALGRRAPTWQSRSGYLRPLAVLILGLLVLQFLDVLRRHAEFAGALGAPVPQVGLCLAMAGSLVLTATAFIKARRVAA